MLINKKSSIPLTIKTTVDFREDTIHITDKIEKTGTIQLKSLVAGIKFSSIHMASSRYFTPAQLEGPNKEALDVKPLLRNGFIKRELIIDLQKTTSANKDA